MRIDRVEARQAARAHVAECIVMRQAWLRENCCACGGENGVAAALLLPAERAGSVCVPRAPLQAQTNGRERTVERRYGFATS